MIKELNKYSEELTRYRKNNTLPQGEVKNALVDIYEANWQSNKHWGSSKINRGCPSCIGDMMKSLCAEFEKNLVEHRFNNVELGGAQPNVKVEDNQVKVDFESMAWGKLKKYATEQGVNVKGKKKVDIIAELREIND